MESRPIKTGTGRKIKKIILWLSLTCAYTGAVVIVSIRPLPEVAPYMMLDKALHFGAYLVMGLLLLRSLRLTTGSASPAVFFGAFLASFFIGATLELWQGTIPQRSATLGDGIANGAGAAVGVITYKLLEVRYAFR